MMLPDPEAEWDPPPATRAVDRAEVERRIGPSPAPLEVLAGGRANLNVRVGADRVLRIHRRDPAAAAKEAALLARPWRTFRVPALLDAGADFLVLAWLEHGPVPATAEAGVAVGRALAEIHATGFDRAGLLDAELRVVAPLPPHELADSAGPPVLLHGDFKPANLRWTPAGELVVFDWEFALAGPALFDVGQLLRWSPPAAFVDGFAAGYGALPAGWRRTAELLDLVNLVELGRRAAPGSRRAADVARRIAATLV
jgi:fructosamine-3-kinase